MTSPAFFSAPPINFSSVKKHNSQHEFSPLPTMACACDCFSIRRTRKRIAPSSIKASSDSTTIIDDPSVASSSSASLYSEGGDGSAAKIGSRVRVEVPLKVYHIPKVPEFELNGMEGVLKQYVGVWKGKNISANLPYKIEFFAKIEGRDAPVKFFAHLKEDEFEYLD